MPTDLQDHHPILDSDARMVYRHLAAHGSASIEEVSAQTGLPPTTTSRVLRTLRKYHLVERDADSQARLAAVSPDVARIQVVTPLLREIQQLADQVDQAHELLNDVNADYEQSVRRSAIEFLPSADSANAVIDELVEKSQEEVLLSCPGNVHSQADLDAVQARAESLLRRGVVIRCLYQHSARFTSGTAEHVSSMVEMGAQVRTRSDGFMKLAAFDQKAALIEQAAAANKYVLVLDRSVVTFMRRSFQRAWSRGTPFSGGYQRAEIESISRDIKETIIHLLVEGIEDKVIARRLGISLRTCQRHIAEILQVLGARNRLHAGYLIRDRGLHSPDSHQPADEPGDSPD
ncbi:helix-turn-helix domain-containing protein [Streptomyces sp. NPDC051104]|uniref:helix-turn-helix domain-containing protein n=1 Tax=Streptomyces sp. NPDC051104 TaxID=3155044 RepID=UPI003418D85D